MLNGVVVVVTHILLILDASTNDCTNNKLSMIEGRVCIIFFVSHLFVPFSIYSNANMWL